MPDKAVLMLAYGSPDSPDDMEAYLLDIRGGRPTPEAFANVFRERYDQIGGSPLTARTFEQAQAVEAVLRTRGDDLPVYVGMRHWKPWIKDTVAQMQANGIQEAVALVMAPHYSSMNIGRYWAKVNEAQEALGSNIRFTFVDSWWQQPGLLAAQEAHVRAGLEVFPEEVRNRIKLVFSAHSLPERLLKMGDPYDDELKGNARALVGRLGDVDWTFCYQSAAKTGEPWLGPQIENLIVDLAESGYRYVLAAPIGFVCDHVEILYDIDIGAKKIAENRGVRLERIDSMNADPVFIEAVADAILKGLEGKD